jgi:MFS family permease
MIFIAAQLALILRLPVPSYVPWIVVAAVGAGTVLSYAILAEYFPKELAGRANAALNVFHIGGAFVVQYMTGIVVQLWVPIDGHYPEVAYQAAFAFNVGLQIVAGVWFALTWILTRRGERNELDAFSLKPLHACPPILRMSVHRGRPECAGRPARSRWCKSITMKE